MDKNSRIYIAGHMGMVGSAFVRWFENHGYTNLIVRPHFELDLLRQESVESFFEEERPEYVVDAAALVGGIKANSLAPANFFYENMEMEQNLIWSAHKYGVKKFLFLGSACMYPKESRQPMKEDEILKGLPEVTNEGYALAKICGSRLCSYINRQFGECFISAIPANTYGIGDSFDPERSHVIPALMLKYHNSKLNNLDSIELWGTGKALREFIYVDDIASAGAFLLEHYSDPEPINIGTGEEVSMLELSVMIKRITGFKGDIITDPSRPDGMPRRLCDSSRLLAMGWKPQVNLEEGLRKLYGWFRQQYD